MITIERLNELVSYSPDTGLFVWATTRNGHVMAGRPAGYKCVSDGYIRIELDGKAYLAHRLAWLYMRGEWPVKYLDHINGTRDDNRFANLREATKSENAQNIRRMKGNRKDGLLGAHFHKRLGKWTSAIRVNYKQKHLGLFDTKEAAHAAYLAAKRELHPFGEVAK